MPVPPSAGSRSLTRAVPAAIPAAVPTTVATTVPANGSTRLRAPSATGSDGIVVRVPDRGEILPYLAPDLRRPVGELDADLWAMTEELRLRRERPLAVVTSSGDRWLSADGRPTDRPEAAHLVSADDAAKTLSLISQGSVYALEEEFRHGFVTLPGGHRVGLTGRALLEAGHIRTITHVAGLNIRLSREVRGTARPLLGRIVPRGQRPRSTLIISPPGCGKTTILRDLVRLLSDGVPELGLGGFRIGLVDERSEVAACYEGVPQRDVGLRTDVLDGCPKAEGVFLLLRAMSPEVIAADEVGRSEDVAALHEAAGAGAAVVATAHAASLDDLSSRPMLRELMRSGVFRLIVVLSRRDGPGTIESVHDPSGGRGLPG